MEEETIQNMTKMLMATLTDHIDFNKILQTTVTAIVAFFFNKKMATPIIKKVLSKVKEKINEKIDSVIDQSMLRLGTTQNSKEMVTNCIAQEMRKFDTIMKNLEDTTLDFDVMARFDEKTVDIDKKIRGIEESMERRMKDFEIKMNALMKSVTQCTKKKETPIVHIAQQDKVQLYTGPKKEYDPRDKL
ncbi:NSP4 [Rotavirus G chicken/03V0567/DEU/2003]|uniref:NSP4 n=1 Tax=Rotavirus G chicken/03V0567/DEU/2003 TaxID=994995 RepID=M4H2P7_9REOV|nr:NSP4 [Rotavirus G chicken/03V0567/DEU/2003]AFL91901.1 NSP4 [Rotavirus G chicken/03V0567/DEU/2003]